MRLEVDHQRFEELIRDVPDFPEPGVVFKDVTPLLLDKVAFSTVVDAMCMRFGRGEDEPAGLDADHLVDLAAPVAYHLGAGFVPARKIGKLPGPSRQVSYQLEYGDATLELHDDAIQPGDRVLVVDDVLATGGTAAATVDLVRQLGGEVVGCTFLLELGFLDGARQLAGLTRYSLLEY